LFDGKGTIDDAKLIDGNGKLPLKKIPNGI